MPPECLKCGSYVTRDGCPKCYKQNRIEAFLEKLKNLTKEDIENIDAEYSDFICRTNITIDLVRNRVERIEHKTGEKQ